VSQIVDFARQELGLELYAGQAQVVDTFEAGGHSQLILQCGRRAGKSTLADVFALYDATARDHLRSHIRLGEPRISAIIAPRIDQASSHIARCAELARHSPRLQALVVNETSDQLVFRNGSVIKALPCSARSIRGEAWSSCVLDELGHFLTAEDGNAAGDRVLDAALPSLAQFGDDGWLIVPSTPLWRQGALWKLVERAQSGRFPYMLHIRRSTAEMNPAISEKWLEDRRREDPDAYGREFEAQFVDGASSYLASADVVACVRHGQGILPPGDGRAYVGALDPAYSLDNFAMAVGHVDAESKGTVIDGVWCWRRHGHEATLDDVARLAREYHLTSLRTDQACAQPIKEALQRRGIAADYKPWTNQSKADAFSALKIGLNSRTVELPDDTALIEELCSLEARPTAAGFTKIAAAGNAHDDRAVAIASVVEGLRRPNDEFVIFSGDGSYRSGGQSNGDQELGIFSNRGWWTVD